MPLVETEKDLSEEEFLACPQFHALFAEGEVRMHGLYKREKDQLKKDRRAGTQGETGTVASVRTNYKTICIFQKRVDLCLLQRHRDYGIVNRVLLPFLVGVGTGDPGWHLVYQMEAERDGRAKTANSAKSF